jgi:hypothetical protein
MSMNWREAEHWDKVQAERDYERAEEEREKAEAFLALEVAFIERPGCTERCFDAALHTAECLAASAATTVLAEPVSAALAGWVGAISVVGRRAA